MKKAGQGIEKVSALRVMAAVMSPLYVIGGAASVWWWVVRADWWIGLRVVGVVLGVWTFGIGVHSAVKLVRWYTREPAGSVAGVERNADGTFGRGS